MAGGSDNGSASDGEPKARKRGEALEDAIRQACAAELAEHGVRNVTVESVALRAKTGKASIYRRWPTREALVTDCLSWMLCGVVDAAVAPAVHDGLSTRDALVLLVREAVTLLQGPNAEAFRSLLTESLRDEQFKRSMDVDLFDPRKAALLGLLRLGVERGDVVDGPILQLVPEIIVGTLLHTVLLERREAFDVELFVDAALVPIIARR